MIILYKSTSQRNGLTSTSPWLHRNKVMKKKQHRTLLKEYIVQAHFLYAETQCCSLHTLVEYPAVRTWTWRWHQILKCNSFLSPYWVETKPRKSQSVCSTVKPHPSFLFSSLPSTILYILRSRCYNKTSMTFISFSQLSLIEGSVIIFLFLLCHKLHVCTLDVLWNKVKVTRIPSLQDCDSWYDN